jgi:hypothetical protein
MQNKASNEIIQQIQSLFQKYYGPNEGYSSLLNQVLSLGGINQKLQEMKNFEKEYMDDAISELRIASLLHLCGFQVSFLLKSKSGKSPDLKIIKNSKIGFVEVKHKRSNVRSSDEKSDDGDLKEEQDFKKSEGSIRQNVEDALPQLYEFSKNNKCDFFVIAIWISNDEIWDVEVQFSVPLIKSEIINPLNQYTNDILLIYGSDIPDRDNKYFHAIPLLDHRSNVINPELIQEIEKKPRDEIFGIHRVSFLEWSKSKNIEK